MSKKKTTEEFQKEIWEKFGRDYTLISEYNGANIKVTVKHDRCGYEWNFIPYSINNLKGCKKCIKEQATLKITKSNEEYQKEFIKKYGNTHELLSEYVNDKTKILVKHKECNYEWYVLPYGFKASMAKDRITCPKCSGNIKYTNESFDKILTDLTKGEYIRVSDINGANKKVKLKHIKCGNEWDVKPANFVFNESRCPKCASSKGERVIANYLKSKNIDFKPQ